MLLILVCLLSGCAERTERRNYSISNPKERSSLSDAQLVDRLKQMKPDHYDDLFDDANDRLMSTVVQSHHDKETEATICIIAVPPLSDPRRYLGQEIIVFREYTFVAKVLAVSVVPEGLACRLITASEKPDAMPIRVGDQAQSRL